MKTRATVMFALLVPGLAMLAACDRNKPDADDAATPPAAETTPAPADTTAAAPADDSMSASAGTTPPPAEGMQGDTSQGNGMQGDAMSADNGGMSSGGSDKTFAEMDKNHDGSVTKDELDASDMLYQHFSTADANGDGKLSEDEIAKHRADMAASPAK